jgi:hypothetical protein
MFDAVRYARVAPLLFKQFAVVCEQARVDRAVVRKAMKMRIWAVHFLKIAITDAD